MAVIVLGFVLMFAAAATPTSTPVVSTPSHSPTPATPTPAATATPTLGQFDAQIGTVTMQAGQTAFVLNSGAMDRSRCAGQQISIYGADGTVLTGRARPGYTTTMPASLTTTIASCSDATHGQTVLPAKVSVKGARATNCTNSTTTPFSPGCVRWGTDVSGPLNALIHTGVPISLPTNAVGYAKDSITPIAGTSVTGNGATIMDGWEAGYSATHPLGMNGVVIAGASHANRIPNVTIQTLTVDNGLDFDWNQLGNGQPMGIFATYFSNLKLSHNRINNTLRGIGLMEDGNVALLDTNTYTGNHEDSEHWGESYNAGDVVSNVTSQNARLNGYSDDGIAIVGGNMPCTTNQSTPGGPVENSQIIHPTIVGSRNSGGSKIHTCAIQLAGNLNGVNVQSPDIAKPALCSIQIMDYFGGAPQNVQIVGGHAEAGSGTYFSVDLIAAPIVISSEAGPSNRVWPGCPTMPVGNVSISGMDLDMGAQRGIARHIGAPYYYSSVAGACFSVVGYVNRLSITGNKCHNDLGATGHFGLYVDPDTFNAVPVGITLSGNAFDFTDTSSALLHNSTNGAVVNLNNIVHVGH